MAEANRSLEQTPPPNQAQRQLMTVAVMALAQQRAIKAVKLQFQKQGLKPAYMARRITVAAARDYLGNHPELIAEAKATVLQWHAKGVFGPRGGIRSRT